MSPIFFASLSLICWRGLTFAFSSSSDYDYDDDFFLRATSSLKLCCVCRHSTTATHCKLQCFLARLTVPTIHCFIHSFALFFVWVKARSDAVAVSAIYRLSACWQQQQQHGSDLPDALFIFFIVITGALIQLADLPIQSVCVIRQAGRVAASAGVNDDDGRMWLQ